MTANSPSPIINRHSIIAYSISLALSLKETPLKTDIDKTLFPCNALPDDAGQQKLLGLYQQVQDGVWLQRIKVPGGRLTGRQWNGLAEIAQAHTPATPLHLTTRQDIEIHDLTPSQIPALQRHLAELGLTTFQAAGDTFRNITVCSCAGVLAGTPDLMELARGIESALHRIEGIYELPRKFKIALMCSPKCGQPWINDLGLIASARQGQWGFSVRVAGSLGAKPNTGIEWFEWVPASDVFRLAAAAVRVFAREGDRENRRTARLRHVRERMGDAAFLDMLNRELDSVTKSGAVGDALVHTPSENLHNAATLTFANGDITQPQAIALGTLADRSDVAVHIDNHHRVIVFASDAKAVAGEIADTPSLAEPLARNTTIVACPGKRWCRHAIAHTNKLADRIRRELADALPAGATVCISGCPNGCSHPAVADIGLIGGTQKRLGQACDVFTLLAGGGMGRDARLATRIENKLNEQETVDAIARYL